jgi:hypothetical protein
MKHDRWCRIRRPSDRGPASRKLVHVICVDNNEQKVADADLGPVNEFIQSPNHFDGRNQFDRRLLVEMGFDYYGIGR